MTLTQAYARGQTADPIESTIGQRLNEIDTAQPNHPGLIMPHQNIRWSYAEFLAEVDKLATGLLKLGLFRGDRVAIWSPTDMNGIDPVRHGQNWRHYGVHQSRVSTHELEYALNKVTQPTSAESFKTSYYLEMLLTPAPEPKSCAPGEPAR